MARKKKEAAQAPGSPGWMATFGDLMNLLLCFFVLLFAMSTVDADKYEALVTSMSNSVSIFDGGGAAVGDDVFVSSGTNQMVSLTEYFAEFDEQGSGEDSEADDISKYKEQLAEEQKKVTEELYEEIIDVTEKSDIIDYVDIEMDESFQYVQLSLRGAILFDSGKATIKDGAYSLLNKVGNILKLYDKHLIKIEGHTDNVKINSSTYGSNMWLSTARATEVFEYLTKKKGLDPKTLEASGRSEYDPIASNDTAEGRTKNRRVEVKIYSSKN